MNRPRFSITLLSLAALLWLPPHAAAQAETNDELAKKCYKLGSELYSSSNYEDALELFKKSYGYSNRHALLYNMGRCHVASS